MNGHVRVTRIVRTVGAPYLSHGVAHSKVQHLRVGTVAGWARLPDLY